MRRIERVVLEEWRRADEKGERYFPHEFLYQILRSGELEAVSTRSIRTTAGCSPPAEKNLPIFVPGWEDSTLGNIFAALLHRRQGQDVRTMRAERHRVHDRAGRLVPGHRARTRSIGFFQIGGGIAGDFPICVVPMMHQDLARRRAALGLLLPDQRFDDELRLLLGRRAEREDHLGQARLDTPKFVIESDATIVAPLMFAKILGW